MTRVAIVQSNYVPWKGYFDLIASVDTFVLYDDVQYTKNDWRNRNKIKTPNGVQWLTIPVSQGIDQRICDVRVTDQRWPVKHWKAIKANYARATHFKFHEDELAAAYEAAGLDTLSEVNAHFVNTFCRILGIETAVKSVVDFVVHGDRNERLVDICVKLGADTYISGPAARSYLDEAAFAKAGIAVEWFDYSGYASYPQLWGDFEHGVSIIDTILNCGAADTASMLGRHRP
jgi:hypothetical protein